MKKVTTGGKIAVYFLQLILVLIIFIPLVFAFVSSVRPLSEIYAYIRPLCLQTFFPKDFTPQAYVDIFTKYSYEIPLFNSIFIAATTIAFGIIINAMAGFAFAKFHFRFKNILFVVVMITFMIPTDIISINLYSLMIKINWINTYWALIVPGISSGLVIFMFRQFYYPFPNYMIESAMIDGFSWPKIFWYIVLPNSKPICVSAGLILFLSQWETFLWPILVTRTPQMQTIQIALVSFQTQYTKYWNDIFAASIIAFIIPILIIIPLQRFFVQGITLTGTKD